MKKFLCIIITMFIFVVSGCLSENIGDYYKFNHTGVTEVTGISQMSDSVKDVVISKESVEQLLSQIEGLCLPAINQEDSVKGWGYLFTIKYNDGSTTQVSLSEEIVKIDSQVYKTTLYKADDFAKYFD